MVPLLVVRLPIYLKLRNLMPIWTLIPTIALTLCKETAVVRQVSPVVVHLFLDFLLGFLCLIGQVEFINLLNDYTLPIMVLSTFWFAIYIQ